MHVVAQQGEHHLQHLGVLREHDVRPDVVMNVAEGKGPGQPARFILLLQNVDRFHFRAILEKAGQRKTARTPRLSIPNFMDFSTVLRKALQSSLAGVFK